jgi:hypothetical protein
MVGQTSTPIDINPSFRANERDSSHHSARRPTRTSWPFTLIFYGDITGNPFTTTTPYGIPYAIAIGNALERNKQLAHRIDRLEGALIEARRRLAKTRATWNAPCYECDAVLAKALNEIIFPDLGHIDQHTLVVEGRAYPIEKRWPARSRRLRQRRTAMRSGDGPSMLGRTARSNRFSRSSVQLSSLRPSRRWREPTSREELHQAPILRVS